MTIANQQISAEPNYPISKTLSQYRLWLEKSGRIIKLTTKPILRVLDVTAKSAKDYESVYAVIRAKGIEFVGNTYYSKALYYALEMGDRDNFDPSTLEKYKTFVDSLKKTDPKLVESVIAESKALEANLRRLKVEIEKFYFENQLEPATEPGLLPGNLFVPRY